MSALALQGIGKAFAGVRVLDDVSLNVDPGEVVGVVGENGAGKSTLMNIVGGLVTPDAGTMSVAGIIFLAVLVDSLRTTRSSPV